MNTFNPLRLFWTFVCALVITSASYSQNLVPNPGFENYATCPVGFSQFNGYISTWVNPSTASPDYYNACANPNPVSVPGNTTGYQPAHSGNAYAGMYTTAGSIYREFIQVQLTQALQAGNQYQFEMYVSLANKSKTAVDDIGAYFSVTAPTSSGTGYLSGNPQPQISNAFGNVITDTLNWVLISGTYTATGGERYLTIGHFKDDAQCTYQTLPYGNLGAYYFFDDISLTGAACCNDSLTFSNLVPESCTGNNGSVASTFHSACGSVASNYTWSNGTHNASLANVVSGMYQLTVTDNNGCSASSSIMINHAGNVPALSMSPTATSCGHVNGSATVSATGGSGSYTYLWSNNANAASIANVPSGTYQVTVTDSTGCSATASTMVNSSSGIGNVSLTADTSLLCAGDSASICAPSGYTYLWNTGATSTCIFANQAGNYYVTVTDNNTCTAESNHLPISVYPQPPVSISVNGDTLSAFNAVSYQWYEDGNIITGADSGTYIVTHSGSYVVQVTDTNGCHALSLPVVITVLGINNLNEPGISVYPNPSENGTWILNADKFFAGDTAEIYDAGGRKLVETEITSGKNEMKTEVPRGVYFLKVYSHAGMYTLKLVKL